MTPHDAEPARTRRIVVIGGYGAVGRVAASTLARRLPQAQVVVAGRHPNSAPPVPGTTPVRLDADDEADVARSLDGTDAVLVCAEVGDTRLARACLQRGIDYIDVSASHRLLTRIEGLGQLAGDHDATAVLSVGLVPGVSNLLARHCVDVAGVDVPGIDVAGIDVAGIDVAGPADVEIGVLLGTGDQHGAAAIDWTLSSLAELGPGWRMTFPPPYGRRTVHRFPFSDQYTLPRTLRVERVRTGLCLDSRAGTSLLAVGGLSPVARMIGRPRVRSAVVAALSRVHPGRDGFSVTASTAGVTSSFSGRNQSRVTGIVAALTTLSRNAWPAGVWHLDQVVDARGFLTRLATCGFDLDLAASGSGTCQ